MLNPRRDRCLRFLLLFEAMLPDALELERSHKRFSDAVYSLDAIPRHVSLTLAGEHSRGAPSEVAVGKVAFFRSARRAGRFNNDSPL